MSYRPFTALALALGVGLSALPAPAQTQSRVQFQSGTSGATINGTVVGNEYIDYLLGAQAGQTLDARIEVDGTNGDGTIYFNIMPPGATYETIFLGQTEGRAASVTLPKSGEYTIRVYLMGNDADTGRTVGFRLPVSIR